MSQEKRDIVDPNLGEPSLNALSSSYVPHYSYINNGPSEELINIAIEDAKRVRENFKSKMASFPKHLSYEGSVVLCVMLSMNEVAYPNMSNLPMSDQNLIKNMVKPIFLKSGEFKVKFDNEKDFLLTFSSATQGEFEITMFNSVAHPRPEDLKGADDVLIEKNGDKIEVGGKIVLNRKGIEKLIGVNNNTANGAEEDNNPPRRQPVAGRNAFEIRTDILQLSLDYVVYSKYNLTPEGIVDIAKKFYAFVENKR